MPLINNYGAILQAFALKTVLERMGHNVTFIEHARIMKEPKLKAVVLYPYRFLKKYVLGNKYTIINYEKVNNRNVYRDIELSKNIAPFVERNFKIRIVSNFADLRETDYDGYIVGSDQVWRHFYSRTIIGSTPATYLDFTLGWQVKRISYAASFGTTWWELNDNLTKYCGNLLAKFDAVSVRELDGIDMCKRHFNYSKAINVLDPTMLLLKEDYEKLFISKVGKSAGDLLCYILDNNSKKETFIGQAGEKMKLTPMWITDIEKESTKAKPAIETWLRCFYDAKYIITDSFHACVFAILFKKPFVVILNENRGLSRFYSLLRMFGLEDRLIKEDDEYELPHSVYSPNYEELEKMRKKSYAFLEKALG